MEFQQEVLILVLHSSSLELSFPFFSKFQNSGDFWIAINNNASQHWHRNEQRFVQAPSCSYSRAGIVKQANGFDVYSNVN
jgi:hypothetical protein